MKRYYAFAAAVLAVMVSSFTVTGCSSERAVVTGADTARPVRTIVVERSTVGADATFVGRTQAAEAGSLSFQVPGRVERVDVGIGTEFAAGDTLMTLETEDLALRRDEAAAGLKAAEASLRNARRDFARAQELLPTGGTTQREFDAARTRRDQAEAEREAARQRLTLREREFGYATLEARSAGSIVATLVEPGEIIVAGQPVARFASQGAVEVAFPVSAKYRSLLAVGDAVDVTLPGSGEGQPLEATVTEIAEASAGRANAFEVVARLPEVAAAVRPGMPATVHFAKAVGEGLVIPPEAVAHDATGTFVFVVEKAEGTPVVRRRNVKIGTLDGDGLLVASGLKVGERLVIAGAASLRDGTPVRLP